MSEAIYRNLTAKDLDNLIKSAIDDFDLWAWYDENQPERAAHITRVAAAYEEINEESGNES